MKRCGRWIGVVCCLVLAPVVSAQEDGGALEDGSALDATAGVDVASGLDASAGADAASGCGEVTWVGRCDGDSMSFCLDGVLHDIDCAQRSLTCGLVDCTSEGCHGHDCVAQLGQACDPVPCDFSLGHGCLQGVCADSTPCNAVSYAHSCQSETVVSKCFANSYDPSTGANPDGIVWDFDCSLAGTEPYICGERSDGTEFCLGQDQANCGPEQGYECVAGLECVAGICLGEGQTDAGLPSSDASVTGVDTGNEGDGDGGADDCACRGGAAGSSAVLLAALLLAAGRLRRRR